jgi:cytochrome P450
MESILDDPRDVSDPVECLRQTLAPEHRAAHYDWLHRLRELAPILPAEGLLVDRGFILTRYDDIRSILRHPEVLSDERAADIFDVGPAGASFTAMMHRQILYLPPAEHDRIRALVARHFTPRRVEAWRHAAELEVEALLAAARERGKLELVRDLAYPLPIAVICALMGIDRSDVPLFLQWSHDFARRGDVPVRSEEVVARGEAAVRGLRDYFLELLAIRRRKPQDDLISLIVQARDGGEPLSDEDLVANCVLLLQAGHETTADLIGLAVRGLLLHPGELALLRAEPGRLVDAVEECLRWDTSVQIVQRRSQVDLEIRGTRIPAGELCVLLNGAANRDPAQYADPDRLDIDRAPRDHLAFGFGRHRCLGAALARVEIQAALAGLLRLHPNLAFDGEARLRGSFFLRGLESLPLRDEKGIR